MGKAKRRGFAAPKGSQPRLVALVSPFQGKGLAWILPPSYGRRCPEGAEVGWGKRYEKERKRSSQVRRLREHPIHRYAVPLPQWGRQRGGASSPQKEANPALLRSAVPSKGRSSRGHSLLPMEGGAPKGRRLDGGSGMKKGGEIVSSVPFYESTLSTARGPPSPMGKATKRGKRYLRHKAFPAWGRWRAERAG